MNFYQILFLTVILISFSILNFKILGNYFVCVQKQFTVKFPESVTANNSNSTESFLPSILYVNVITDYSNFKSYMQAAVYFLQANIFVTSTIHLPEEIQFYHHRAESDSEILAHFPTQPNWFTLQNRQ